MSLLIAYYAPKTSFREGGWLDAYDLQGKTPREREAYLKDLLGYQEEPAEEKELREAKAKTPEPVNAHIRKLERELFHTWAFIMEEGLYSEASEYVNEHKDEETPFEW